MSATQEVHRMLERFIVPVAALATVVACGGETGVGRATTGAGGSVSGSGGTGGAAAGSTTAQGGTKGRAGASAQGGSGASAAGAAGGRGGQPDFVLGDVEVLATDLQFPIRIAVDDTYVYWANRGSAPLARDGSIRRLPKTGGTTEVLLSDLAAPAGIALRGAEIFWTNVDDKQVLRARTDGSGLQLLADVSAASTVTDIAINEGVAYVGSTMGHVHILELDTLSSARVDLGARFITRFAFDSQRVYCNDADYETPTGSLYAMSLDGKDPVQLATGLEVAEGLALLGGDLYFTEGGLPDDPAAPTVRTGGVRRVPTTGGPVETLYTSQSEPYALATDGRFLYFTERAESTAGVVDTCDVAAGRLLRMTPDGEDLEILAADLLCPSTIVVDDTGVYWVNNGDTEAYTGGSIMRIPKEPM